jgi:hypothetical protein
MAKTNRQIKIIIGHLGGKLRCIPVDQHGDRGVNA